FVVGGPYRFTRNPMYVSMAALYLGLSLALNSWWPVVLLPFVLLIIQRAVIAREERYLRARFPVEYPEYCRTVRRWL
ncbi:MAG: methyltransferase family protein, partial [Gemmatimonadaceae bacterium]